MIYLIAYTNEHRKEVVKKYQCRDDQTAVAVGKRHVARMKKEFIAFYGWMPRKGMFEIMAIANAETGERIYPKN